MAADLDAMNTALPIVAAGLAGVAAMIGMILRGLRAERDLVCPGRAAREAATRTRVEPPAGAGAEVVGQRAVREGASL